MAETITAGEKPLVKVFNDDFVFSIPPYQRPYAWTTSEAGELLDDLLIALGVDDPAQSPPYFLGSIVLIKDPQQPMADVVDGQQRLTTLTILLAVLRDLAANATTQNDIDTFIRQRGIQFVGTQDQFRLTLRERDASFFERQIQAVGATADLPDVTSLTDSQANLVKNAAYFIDALSDMSVEDRNRLVTFIITRCFLVVVQASDATSAYRIFAVMNDRGLDLSPTDILKSEIIGALPEQERDPYTEKWESIEEELGRDEFEDLFGHIRMISRRQKLRGTLEAEFRKYVPAIQRPKEFIDDILTPLAAAYLEVLNQDFESVEFAEDINRRLVQLSRLDNYDWEAPAISFIAKSRRDPAALRQFLTDLERLAYGLFILRANINERINRYSRLLTAIEFGEDLAAESSPLQLTRSEQFQIGEALNGPVYEQTRVRMPLLLRLDEAVSDGSASYNHRVITVEHILPQNPADDSEWLAWFPEEELRSHWVHRLGNLVLLSRPKNSQASNFEFDRKKEEYFARRGTSPFALTSQVLQQTEWTPAHLEQRQQVLVEKLCQEWRLDISPLTGVEEFAAAE